MQDISKYFKKAGLNFTLTDKPIGRFSDNNANRVFQMTIDANQQAPSPERFRIFKGQGNDVRVLDVDHRKQQLLLFVKEPKRSFMEVRFDREQSKDVETKRETPEGIRRYLMGMDERHLFISELPDKHGKINTVEDAHRVLKPYDVKDRKKRKKIKVYRQGEWFFIKAMPTELLLINENIKFAESKQPIVSLRFGKPHIAENILRIKTDELTNENTIFVKGKIKHDDHKTKEFFVWHKVFRNTEKLDINSSRIHGWID